MHGLIFLIVRMVSNDHWNQTFDIYDIKYVASTCIFGMPFDDDSKICPMADVTSIFFT